VATLEGYAPEQESLIGLVERCHEALRTTRGVVLSLAWLSAQDQNLTWLGVGNVEGMLLHAELSANPAYESIVPRRGVVGYQLPPLRAAVVPLIPHDTLIFVTDGIALDFAQGYAVSEAPQPAAERIMNQFRKGTDDALVLVARYRGGGEGDRERGQRPE
jgi:hypothetical protein